MYFPPLVWDNILDYLGIWEETYNNVVKDIPKAWRDLPALPTPVGFYYKNETDSYNSSTSCSTTLLILDDTNLWIIQRYIRETSLLKIQRGYNIATYWIEPYIKHHNRAMGMGFALKYN